jgi:CheY-like chemotaxis protein/anti-sigma regulatory factor (Ser/Thr protein kinase)
MHKIMRESVSMRFENLALIQQITHEKERAETANHAKSQFLAAASHDLRQPIHAMALFVATLRALSSRAEIRRADIEGISERLQDALKNLGQLLSALLDVSRLDAGVVEANKRPIALQASFSAVLNEFSGQAESKGLDLTVVPTSLWVDSDPIVLRRILSNLISNALRYTPRGRILVGCRRREDMAEIQIWDTGIGIDTEQLPKIFQEFYQVHNAVRDREQGLGLGLAIVKRLTKLLGAELDVRSTPGKGSMFSLRLPLAPQAAVAPLQIAKAPAPALAQERKTVLAIDDDPDILDAVNQLLSAWGHTAVLASNLEEAVQKADKHAADIRLIVSDYRLEETITGADAIRAVLKQLNRNVPAAIITGDTSPDRIREASASGFTLLHKPLAPEELHQLIEQA